MPKTGMAGFNHVCNTDRVRFQDYKIAIKDSEYTEQEKTIIWDFYVTHNIAGQTSLQVTLSDYGWNMGKNIKEKSLVEIEEGLMKIAGIDKLCCIRSKKLISRLLPVI